MVLIRLDKRYWLRSDKNQWILAEGVKGRDPQAVFFSTDLEYLLNKYLDMRLRLSEATSFQDLYNHCNDIKLALSNALQPLKMKVG